MKAGRCRQLLTLLSQYHDKQEDLSYQNSSEKLKGYSYCEVHCLDFIHAHEMPNVTRIAASLRLARGSVSRILRRLEKQGLIRRFQIPSNRKEVYFALTEEGRDICRLHALRHQKWLQRDEKFLSEFSEKELDWLIAFFTRYNCFLNGEEKEGTYENSRFDEQSEGEQQLPPAAGDHFGKHSGELSAYDPSDRCRETQD